MKNRWILSLFILVFIMSSCVSIFANENLSGDEAKKIATDAVEKYFDIDIDNNFEVTAEESYEEGAWDINICREDENYVDVDVYIEPDKTVSSVSIYGDVESDKQITKTEARKLADNVVNKMHSDKVKNTKCIEKEDEYSFNFEYNRILNEVEFDQEGIYITVDKETGRLSEYSLNWNKDMDIPKVENVIDKSKAAKIIQDNIEMKPMYMNIYDEDGNEKVSLVYNPYYKTSSMVDAKDGELEYYIKNIDQDMMSKENYKESVSVKTPNYNLNEQETRDLVTQKIKELLNKDITITSIEELADDESKKTSKGQAWGAKFSYKDQEGNEANGKIVIDKNNKEIIHMDTDFEIWDETDVKPKYTWEDGYERALQAIKDSCQSKGINIDTEMTKEAGYYEDKEGNVTYDKVGSYSFNRVVNGVVYRDNDVSVYVDLNTNNVLAIESEWDNTKVFSDKNKALDIEKVKQAYLDKNEVKLCYVTIYDQESDKKEIKLMYKMIEKGGMEDIKHIDALTGEFLDYSGDVIKKN
ncbi:YcdB/YcdC domain-containing protein [Tepidibacter mesophilus]|uniref:YcdB/YcdC domain-containing protein n=1 Tax=Tepidibacter mesophilus TaxID=655607 RepID=UPI000C069D13|nr:YcdB/YcdC domain-containing protein [Tepidibacter mesophilus]